MSTPPLALFPGYHTPPGEEGYGPGPASSLARGIVVLLFVTIGLSVIGAVAHLGQFMGPAGSHDLTWADALDGVVSLSQLGLLIGTGITFLIWFSRAYRNLTALGASGLRSTPSMSVGWWFVPFYSLVRPYQLACEIWKASDPTVPSSDQTNGRARLPTGMSLESVEGAGR